MMTRYFFKGGGGGVFFFLSFKNKQKKGFLSFFLFSGIQLQQRKTDRYQEQSIPLFWGQLFPN